MLALLVTADKLDANPSPRPCVILPSQTFVLANRDDPQSDLYSPELGLAFTRLYRSHKNEDPAPKPQLALKVPSKDQAIADLVVRVFFFLLRQME